MKILPGGNKFQGKIEKHIQGRLIFTSSSASCINFNSSDSHPLTNIHLYSFNQFKSTVTCLQWTQKWNNKWNMGEKR